MNQESFHIWVECYFAEIDERLGIPVRRGGPSRHLLQSGHIKEITEAEAQALNKAASAYSEGNRKYIEEKIASCLANLKAQQSIIK